MTNPNDTNTTSEEIQNLRMRIFNSIKRYNKRRNMWMYGSIAASVSLIIASLYIFSAFELNDFPEDYQSAAFTDFENITDVVLKISKDEQVLISEESSVIDYSSADRAIKINDSRTVRKKDGKDNTFNTLIVPYGKRSEIILSDGTKVWLNSGSKLVYPSFFTGSSREVFLIGEAIFDVIENKEKPFYVTTSDYVVKVVGTVFNISHYPEDSFTSTVLKSGLIQINYQENGLFGFKKSIELVPGTKATYERNSDRLVTSKVRVDTYFSWREGILIFKKDPLEDIVKRVSRYYNVKVQIDSEDLRNERFSGHLNLKSDIFQVIEIINESAGYVFKVENHEDTNIIKLTKI